MWKLVIKLVIKNWNYINKYDINKRKIILPTTSDPPERLSLASERTASSFLFWSPTMTSLLPEISSTILWLKWANNLKNIEQKQNLLWKKLFG